MARTTTAAPAPAEVGPQVGPQVIWSIDDTGMCTLSTGPGLGGLGVRPGDLVGRNLFDVYAADPSAVDALHRVLAGEQFTTESPFHDRILSVYYEPLRGPDGTVTGALGVATDITEQRAAEAEAHAARERLVLLGDLSASLGREALNVQALLDVSARFLAEAVGDAGVLWLLSEPGDELAPRAVHGPRCDVPPPGGECRAVEEHLGPDTTAPRVIDLRRQPEQDPLLSGLATEYDADLDLRLPLVARGQLVGAVDVLRARDRGPVTADDLALATELTERCALAVDNAQLLEQRRVAGETLVKFKALADASTDLIGIAGVDGTAVYVNPRVYAQGIEPELEDLWSTVTQQAGAATTAQMRTSLEDSGRWSGDVTLTFPQETVIHLEVFTLHHPDTGTYLGNAWIGQDVTDLRAAESALREANADLMQFKALVEASPDFIAIASLDGKVTYVNPHGRELVGLDPDLDVRTTTIADYLTPEGLRASVEIEQPAVVAVGHWEGESTLRNLRGPAIPVAIASFLMHEVETGEPFALATVQRDITERLAAETALRDLAEQRQALLTRLVNAQDAERARIAADVHDDPVQALAAVDLRLGLLRRQLEDRAPELRETLHAVQETVSGATDRLRALLFDLEPPDLQHGLTGALERAADEIFENSSTRWSVDGSLEPFMPDSSRAVAYRIAREAMINVRKHADAGLVTVTLVGKEEGLEVTVTDDGRGLGPEPTSPARGHRGLETMQDRATAAGGQCTIAPTVPTGTVVTLWLPAPEAAKMGPMH